MSPLLRPSSAEGKGASTTSGLTFPPSLPPSSSLSSPSLDVAVLGSGKEKPSPGVLDVPDSGYNSSTEAGAAEDEDEDDHYAIVRNDEFEHNASRDWLVNVVKKGSEWMAEVYEDSPEFEERENVVDKAAGGSLSLVFGSGEKVEEGRNDELTAVLFLFLVRSQALSLFGLGPLLLEPYSGLSLYLKRSS